MGGGFGHQAVAQQEAVIDCSRPLGGKTADDVAKGKDIGLLFERTFRRRLPSREKFRCGAKNSAVRKGLTWPRQAHNKWKI
jgi:hypothetical protein